MKLIVIVRTINESHNIATFCQQYAFADKILVADSVSTDNTVAIAKTFPNVDVRLFTEKLVRGDYIDVPESKHTNFLIEWAKTYQPDWIISDDCDCWPNALLKEKARWFFENAENLSERQVNVNRLYIEKFERYYPDFNKSGSSAWAWKPELNVFTDGDEPYGHLTYHGFIPDYYDINFPYCLLHQSWQTDEIIKMKEHRWSKRNPGQPIPFYGIGQPVELPEWAHI